MKFIVCTILLTTTDPGCRLRLITARQGWLKFKPYDPVQDQVSWLAGYFLPNRKRHLLQLLRPPELEPPVHIGKEKRQSVAVTLKIRRNRPFVKMTGRFFQAHQWHRSQRIGFHYHHPPLRAVRIKAYMNAKTSDTILNTRADSSEPQQHSMCRNASGREQFLSAGPGDRLPYIDFKKQSWQPDFVLSQPAMPFSYIMYTRQNTISMCIEDTNLLSQGSPDASACNILCQLMYCPSAGSMKWTNAQTLINKGFFGKYFDYISYSFQNYCRNMSGNMLFYCIADAVSGMLNRVPMSSHSRNYIDCFSMYTSVRKV